MAITTRADLVTSIGGWSLRTDLSGVVDDLIALTEARMNRDKRVRRLTRTDFTVDAETEAVTGVLTSFQEIESLYIDGDASRYGEIEIVSPGTLAEYQRRYGPTGTPRVAAVVDGTLVFAPVPDRSYEFVISYWQGMEPLTATDDTNWVLENHPDAYLAGCLVETMVYLHEDERIPTFAQRYDTALEEIKRAAENEQYSGKMVRRVSNPIP